MQFKNTIFLESLGDKKKKEYINICIFLRHFMQNCLSDPDKYVGMKFRITKNVFLISNLHLV